MDVPYPKIGLFLLYVRLSSSGDASVQVMASNHNDVWWLLPMAKSTYREEGSNQNLSN